MIVQTFLGTATKNKFFLLYLIAFFMFNKITYTINMIYSHIEIN